MAISFDVVVDDLSSVLQLYDRIQVWKSNDGETGTYAEITTDSPEPALLDASAGGPFTVSGLSLSVEINAADPIVVTFSGDDPLPLGLVLDQINLVYPGLATLTPGNLLRLRSPLPGTGSSLRAFGSALIPLFLSGSIVYGKGARIPIGLSNSSYSFTDLAGVADSYYKTRFYSSVTHGVSAYSDPFTGAPATVLPDSSLVKATANLVNPDGSPVVGRRIIFVPVTSKNVSYNSKLFSMLPGVNRLEMVTDGTGHAEIRLVIGSRIRVFFEGSGYSREFDVPSSNFDLFTVLSTQPDPFSIVQAPPFPIRES